MDIGIVSDNRLVRFSLIFAVLAIFGVPGISVSESRNSIERISYINGADQPLIVAQQSIRPGPTIRSKPTPGVVEFKIDICRKNLNHYTIQLTAGGSERSVANFVQKGVWNEPTGYVETDLRGKPWFRVVYGDFPSRKQANAAKKNLPAKLLSNSPWIQKFAALQKLAGGCDRPAKSAKKFQKKPKPIQKANVLEKKAQALDTDGFRMQIEKNNIDTVGRYLRSGMDPNVEILNQNSGERYPALVWATKHPKLVALFLQHGANPNASNAEGYSALLDACRQGNLESVELLLKHGAKVNLKAYSNKTPILAAINIDSTGIVKALLQKDSSLKNNDRLLISAVKHGNPEMVELLLEQGVDPNKISVSGRNALGVAEDRFNFYKDNDPLNASKIVEIKKLLKKYGANVGVNATNIEQFVKRYLELDQNNSVTEIIKLYAPHVAYHNKGIVTLRAIAKDKENYFARWPIRKYALKGPLPRSGVKQGVKVEFVYSYEITKKNGVKTRKGETLSKLILAPKKAGFLIVSEKGEVIRR